MSRRLLAFLSVVSAVVVAACSGAGDASPDPGLAAAGGGDDAGTPDKPPPPPPTEDAFDAPPPAPSFTDTQLAALRKQLDAVVAGYAGATWSVYVVGADTGQVVYTHAADTPLVPASNTKLFTSATAMVNLGDEHRFEETVYGDYANGVVTGDIALVGEQDFTLSTFFYGSNDFPLQVLAADLVKAGLTRVSGNVRAQGEFVYAADPEGTWSPDADRTAVATAFRAALVAHGVAVGGTATTSTSFTPPAGAAKLARWGSVPLSVGCNSMNVNSNNEFADDLSHHIGYATSGAATFAAGTAKVISTLKDLGVDTTGVVFNDGSGLSHGNHVSSHQVASLIAAMTKRPEGLAWIRSFAVAGVSGTIASRMTGGDTRGRFWGKTGTLNGVVALSGVLFNRYDGQRYFISQILNDVADSNAGRDAEDRLVTVMGADHHGLGARPEAPVLASVKNDANGGTVSIAWSPVASSDGYLVWRSRDGKVWDRAEARYVKTTSFRTIPLTGADRLYVRVTAVSAAGDSAASDVYGASVAPSASRVLLVDADDRWASEPLPENFLGAGHDFLVPAGGALQGVAFDSCANEAISSGAVKLGDYGAVIWSLGKESTADHTFDAEEQAAVRAFVAGGGSLLVSGSEVAWDLGGGTDADKAFLHEVLHATYVADDAKTSVVRGAADLAALGPFTFESPGRLSVSTPDQLAPTQGSTAVVDYVGGAGGAAGLVTSTGKQRVVVLGFPLESVDGPDERKALVDLALAGIR